VRIGGLQKVSLIDYPGRVAAVVFTMGCPLRCGYCHNPQIVVPELFGEAIPEEKLMGFLERRKGKLDGVVVTGGEPMMHRDIERFLKAIKAMGYSVKLDTCGAFPGALEAVIEEGLVDYLAMDLKAPLDRYAEVAGVPVDQKAIKRSIEIIRSSGLDYEFRTTVVRGQLSEDDIVCMAESIEGSKKYVLQRFRNSETIDRTFRQRETYSDEEFGRMVAKAAGHVERCEMR
jgi:pyruvate formate lyase activating enzyme